MNVYSKLCDKLTVAFGAIFSVIFSVVICGAVFGSVYNRNWIVLIAVIAVCALVMLIAWRAFGKFEKQITKYFKLILICTLGLLLAGNIFFVYYLRFDPTFDLKAVFGGAIHWLNTGNFADYTAENCHTDYFYIFPNNTGTLVLFYQLFRFMSALGVSDYFAVAGVFNSLTVVGTVAFSVLICRRLFGERTALISLLIFVVMPPFWFMGAVFYTDSLSMIFPVAFYWLLLVSEGANSDKVRIAYYFGAALVAAVGSLIKPTVLIAVIAAVIVYLLRSRFRETVMLIATSLIMIVGLRMAFNGYIYSSYLDTNKAEQMNMPTEYWLSLGLSGEGRYNNDYFIAAISESDPQIRVEVLRSIIADNLERQSVGGTAKIMLNKLCYLYGDGTLAQSDFLDDNPQSYTKLHSYILFAGENYGKYQTAVSGIFLSAMLFMLAAVPIGRKRVDGLMPLICIFGLTLFLLVWEANPRYITNFVPMIFIAAAAGIDRIGRLILNK